MKYPEAYPGISSAPKQIDVSITGKCNLACRYCFYNDSMEKAPDIPEERWLSFFKEAGSIGVQRVCLSGGEPFLRADFFNLIDSIVANKMRYSILTNGTLIDKTAIEKLLKDKRFTRLDSIQVSIDGSNAEIHDKSRPPKSFDKALAALYLLKENNFPVSVRVTINRHNVDDLDQIAALLIEDVGLSGFSTNEADFQGSARCQGQDIILTVEERKRVMASLLELNKRYKDRITAQAGPLSRIRAMDEITRRIALGDTGIKGRGKLSSCGGVFSKMAVLHDGTYTPCNMLPDLVMGKAGETKLNEAWQTSPDINAVRERRKIAISELKECRSCRYTEFCNGGCPGTVMAKTGRLNGIDPLSCYKEYLKEDSL